MIKQFNLTFWRFFRIYGAFRRAVTIFFNSTKANVTRDNVQISRKTDGPVTRDCRIEGNGTVFISLNWDNVKLNGNDNSKSESNISLHLIEKHNKNIITLCCKTILWIYRNKKTYNRVMFQWNYTECNRKKIQMIHETYFK